MMMIMIIIIIINNNNSRSTAITMLKEGSGFNLEHKEV
jgi:hypothetical protein